MLQPDSSATVTAKDSKLLGNWNAIQFRTALSTTDDTTISLDNCEIARIDAINTTGNTECHFDNNTGTKASYANVYVNAKDTTGMAVYGTDLNLILSGTCSFAYDSKTLVSKVVVPHAVFAGVNVTAENGTALYTDAEYTSALTAGVLSEETSVYSKTGAVVPTDETPSQSIVIGQQTLDIKAQMVVGGAMRLPTETSTVDGIRFLAKYNTEDIEVIEALGYTRDENSYVTTISLGDKSAEVKASGFYQTDDGYSYVAGSIVQIQASHITSEFTGTGKLVFTNGSGDTVTVNAIENDNSRSIAYIAHMLQLDTEAFAKLSETAQDKVNTYATEYQE